MSEAFLLHLQFGKILVLGYRVLGWQGFVFFFDTLQMSICCGLFLSLHDVF